MAKNYRFRSETLVRKVAEWWSMKPDFKMSEDQITCLKANPSRKVPPDARTRHQQEGAERRGAGGIP